VSVPRLVLHDSDEGFLRGVRLLDQRARREMGWVEAGGAPSHWDEAWLWTETDRPPSNLASSVFAGYATFSRAGRGWDLDRVWFRQSSRRRGLLSAVWPLWQERYGDFAVSSPNAAMRGFLARVGYVPRPSVVDGLPPTWWEPTHKPMHGSGKPAS
jgi:hypothetical protein